MKSGVVYRSESLHRLTPADLKIAAEVGVRTVIDMRSSGDVERDGGCVLGDAVAYHHLPWYEDHTRPFEPSKPGDPMEATPDWVFRAPASTMATFLRLVRDDYASVDAFLAHVGVDATTTNRLRRRLLDS